MKNENIHLVLASASPRRAMILSELGFVFDTHPVHVDETIFPDEEPVAAALRLAEEKARAAAKQFQESLIIGSDTIVVIDGQILGKPEDEVQAKEMLAMLSNNKHQVITAIAFHYKTTESAYSSTEVVFRAMSKSDIEWYIATGEPMDKAGAYGIQGHASFFIEEITGSYSNVVGLPVQLLPSLFGKFGISFKNLLNNH